jgi:hypothetical protein
MVSARAIRALQKKKYEEAAAAKAAERAQEENFTTAEMTDATAEMNMRTQDEAVGSKRKLNKRVQ